MTAPALPPLPEPDSDCALFNEPAYPAGPCDCRLSTSTAGAEQPKRHTKERALEALDNIDDYARMDVGIAVILDMKILTEFIEDAIASPTLPAPVAPVSQEAKGPRCTFCLERDDLLADIGSPAYISEREIMLSGMSTSTAGAEKPKPGIVVRFQPVSAGLPKLAHYSTSYGGQWTSERCVVIDGFGDVGTSRLSVSASVKEAIDAGRNPPIVWSAGVGSPTVAAWAYAIAIKATLASPTLPAPAQPKNEAALREVLQYRVDRLRTGDWNLRAPQEMADMMADWLEADMRNVAPVAPVSQEAKGPRCTFCLERDCNGECSGDGAMGD